MFLSLLGFQCDDCFTFNDHICGHDLLLNFSISQCRIEEDIAPGLRVWRRALAEARSAAQVALCIQQLQRSIAWEKSIMKVVSVFI